MSLKKFCLLSVFLLACVLLGACENEAEEDGANHADRHPTMETFSKELELQHDTVVEAIVTYGPGLTLTIGDEEEQVSEDFFAKLGVEATPAIDLHVMDQEGRTNKIILLTVETADPTYGSNVHLWAFEYHDIGRRLRSIWALENESVPVEITYNVTGSEGNYEISLHESLHGSRTSEPLAIDKQTYEQIDADGMLQGKLELSAPIDFLLDDVIGYNQQAEFIVRRQLIGDKPDWFPYKDVMMAYFARRGQMIPRTSYTSNEGALYSHNDLNPTYKALYDDAYTDEPLVMIESNSPLKRSSLIEAVSASLESSDPQRSELDYEFHWSHEDRKVSIQFHDVAVGEIVQFALENMTNWLGYEVKSATSVHPRSIVFRKIEQRQPFIQIVDVRTQDTMTWDAPKAAQIFAADKGKEAVKQIFMIDDEKTQLMDPFTGEIQHLPLTIEEGEGLTRTRFYFPDRFFETINYVVESLDAVYRYDETGHKTRLWETPGKRVIYGFSVSPSGEQIAVLYSADEFRGSDAHLVILDEEGSELATAERAGHYNKSDGVIPRIDLEWIDEQTISVPTDLIMDDHLTDGTRTVTLHADGSTAVTETVHQERLNHVLVYPSPSGQHLIHDYDEAIWLVNPNDEEDKMIIGNGTLIGWLDDHHVAWYESYEEGYPEMSFIF